MQPPLWLTIAENELGVTEIPGPKSNNRILEYHKSTTLKATNDDIPWCSAFVNWVMQKAKIPGTLSAAARSWLSWGVGLNNTYPAFGAVVILRRGNNPAQGHVGFYVGNTTPETVRVLGGNQGDKVSIINYKKEHVLGYRWLG
jgi:uncharacterized protein (TIGR02594 family)